jgi:regulator of sigma E protease
MGLRNGDKIVSLDGEEIEDFHAIVPYLILEDVRTIQIERNGQQKEISVPESIIPKLLKNISFIEARVPFYIGGFSKDSQSKKAGLKKGDKIIGINGQPIEYFDEFKDSLSHYKNQLISINVQRDNKTLDFNIQISEEGYLGVYANSFPLDFFEFERTEYSLLASIPAGINKGVETFQSYLKQLKLIFSPKTEAYKSLGGFITIGKIFPSVWNWQAFWSLTAFLSIILAIMNILPIPALDGGHVIFLLYEMVTGRKPSDKFLEYAQMAGMILLLGLLLYANGNDIFKLFNK